MADIKVNKQSSIMIDDGKLIYFDPWEVKDDRKADIIFVTHDHFDHFSPEDINRLTGDDTVVVVPETMLQTFLDKTEVTVENVLALVPGEIYEVKGVNLLAVPSYNIGKLFHTKKMGWCGYVIELNGVRYYVTGDSDDTEEARSVNCDVLFIPIGGKYTMNVNEAVECTVSMGPKKVIPTHYGDVVGEKSDGEKFAKLLKEKAPGIETEIKLYV